MAEERKTDELEEAGVNVEMDEHEDSSESSADDQSEKEEQNETHIKELQQTVVILMSEQETPVLTTLHHIIAHINATDVCVFLDFLFVECPDCLCVVCVLIIATTQRGPKRLTYSI